MIDNLIRAFHESIDCEVNIYRSEKEDSVFHYLWVIGALGKLTRLERSLIGDKIIQKREKTKTAPYGYFLVQSVHTNTAYVFLLSNESDRARRQEFLFLLASKACDQLSSKQLVAIAANGAQLQGESFDALVLNVTEIKKDPPIQQENSYFGELQKISLNE